MSLVRTDREGVAWLELDRPSSRNALTTELLTALRSALTSIQDDPAVRVVVLTGADDVFCAGADLKELGPTPSARKSLVRVRLVSSVIRQIRGLEQPTIAAINGPAIGAGWGLAMACDMTFVAETATFCIPEVAKGLRLPAAIVNRLVEIVGPVRAAEIVLGGSTYDTGQAVSQGWATRLFPTVAELHDGTRTFATELASRPRHSLAAATYPLRRTSSHELDPPPEYAWNEE